MSVPGLARRLPTGPPLPLPAGGGAGGPEACNCSSSSPPGWAARWWWRWRWRQPGGRGRSARLAPLLPREAPGTLSRAAAPRPGCNLGLGAHGGAAHPRGREVRECEARGGERPAAEGLRGGARGPARCAQAAVGGGWPRAGDGSRWPGGAGWGRGKGLRGEEGKLGGSRRSARAGRRRRSRSFHSSLFGGHFVCVPQCSARTDGLGKGGAGPG